eukprot:scaffold27077_cov40-Cyclotella_meneghiniana.AAC.1
MKIVLVQLLLVQGETQFSAQHKTYVPTYLCAAACCLPTYVPTPTYLPKAQSQSTNLLLPHPTKRRTSQSITMLERGETKYVIQYPTNYLLISPRNK